MNPQQLTLPLNPRKEATSVNLSSLAQDKFQWGHLINCSPTLKALTGQENSEVNLPDLLSLDLPGSACVSPDD